MEGFGIIKTGQDESTVEPKLLKSSLFARTSLLFILHLEQDSNSWAMTVNAPKASAHFPFTRNQVMTMLVAAKQG